MLRIVTGIGAALLIALPACKNSKSDEKSGPSGQASGAPAIEDDRVVIDPKDTTCKVDADCKAVYVRCSNCGGACSAVREDRAAAYSQAHETMCKTSPTLMVHCDYDCISANEAKCVDDRCELVKKPVDGAQGSGPAAATTAVACNSSAQGKCISEVCRKLPAANTTCKVDADCRMSTPAICECEGAGPFYAVNGEPVPQDLLKAHQGECNCGCGDGYAAACLNGTCGVALPP